MDGYCIKDGPLILTFEYEPRMGFELFSLSLEERTLRKRLSTRSLFSAGKRRAFFPYYLFSEDKMFLAIPEYTSKRLKEGSNFSLILFDLQTNKEAKVSSVQNGSIEPKKFEGSPPDLKIVYHKHSEGFTREFDFEISKLKKWQKF